MSGLTQQERKRRHLALLAWLGIPERLAAKPDFSPADFEKPRPVPGVYQPVTYSAAHRYAVEQRLCRRLQPLDLYAVNAHRRANGLPPFALLGDA